MMAKEVMMQASPGSRAHQILHKYLQRTNSGKEEGTESLFSADVFQTSLPLSKERVMAIVGSD